MASYDDVMTALRNADASGNTEDAQRLAQIASRMREQPAAAAAPPKPVPEVSGTPQGYAGRVAAIPRQADSRPIPGATPPAPAAPPTITQKARGAVEAALNTVDSLVGGTVGMTGGFLGGLAGAAETALRGGVQPQGGLEEAAVGGAQRATQFLQSGAARAAPTPTGQEYTENVGEALTTYGPSIAGIGPEIAMLGRTMGPAARALGDVGRRAGTAATEALVPSITPQRAANVRAGMEQGLTFAPHQLAESKFVKMAGESAEHVPASFGGARRAERQEKFNRALIKHVNPESDAPRLTGEVLGEAMDRSGGKIGEITSKTDIPLEDVQGGFEAQRRALARTSEDNQRVVGGYIDEFERLAAENNGAIPGSAFKDLNSELGRDIRANAGNPLGNKLSDLQDVVLDAFRGKLEPEARVAYDTSRTEYAKAKTLLPLVAKSVEGDISPGALMGAVTASKAGKEAMGRGRGGELGELARAGRYLVDQKSSGTAERSLVQQLILDPIASAAKVATVYPAAAAYNLAGPAIARAMVRKGLRKGGAEPPPETAPPVGGEPPPGGAGPAGEPPIPGGEATEITPQVVEPAGMPALDPRLAEVERLKAAAESDVVRAALDEHAKTVQKDIAAKAAAAKQAADVRALERAAKGAEDPALRTALQARADKLRAEKIPVGEAKELATTPTPPVEKPGKIPVGKVIEGQPELPAAKVERIPTGEATELPVENVEPARAPVEPIPVGEATEVQPIPAGAAAEMIPTGEATEVQPIPAGEATEAIPTGEATEVQPIPAGNATEIAPEVIEPAQAPEYTHEALFKAAEAKGIETRGRRPSEVRASFEAAWAKEHKLNPFEAERAKAVAKALDIDEKAVENAAVQHERSPRMFDKAIDQIIEQGGENAPETKQVAAGGEGPAAKPESAAGAAPATAEQPRVDRPATPRATSEGDQPGGQGETIKGAGTIGRMAAARGTPNPTRTAAEWANEMARLRTIKPRPLEKLYGKAGPTEHQRTEWETKQRAWQAEYNRASKMQKQTLADENTAFRERQQKGAKPKESRGPAASEAWVNEGLTETQKMDRKTSTEGRDLAGTIAEEARTHDFKPSELPEVVRMRAEEVGVPRDTLRQSVLQHLDAFDLGDARKEQIRRALDPTKPAPRGFEKGAQGKFGAETPEEYAVRRAKETGKPYIVTGMGHAMLDVPENQKLANTDLGGVAFRATKQGGAEVKPEPRGFEKGAQKLNLWRKDPTSGLWRLARDVTPENAEQWLTIFRKDDPKAEFKVSAIKPSSATLPPGRKKGT